MGSSFFSFRVGVRVGRAKERNALDPQVGRHLNKELGAIRTDWIESLCMNQRLLISGVSKGYRAGPTLNKHTGPTVQHRQWSAQPISTQEDSPTYLLISRLRASVTRSIEPTTGKTVPKFAKTLLALMYSQHTAEK